MKSILSPKLHAGPYTHARLPADEFDKGRLLMSSCLGEMFRVAEFDAVLTEFFHELALVLIGLGLERRWRLAVIAEHWRGRSECALPAANQLAHCRLCRLPVAHLLHARHGVRLTLRPTLFRIPSGIAVFAYTSTALVRLV